MLHDVTVHSLHLNVPDRSDHACIQYPLLIAFLHALVKCSFL